MDILKYRDYFEIMYFITGGPILTIIAGFALYQIKVMKEQIKKDDEILKINSKRESIRLAAEQINYYLSDIREEIDKLEKILMKNDLWYMFDENYVEREFRDDYILLDFGNDLKDEIYHETLENGKLSSKIKELNFKLELFSTYFTSGIADEKLAYNSIGELFIYTVNRLLPYIIIHDDSRKMEIYRNVIELYILWKNRIPREKEVNKKTIRPIGT